MGSSSKLLQGLVLDGEGWGSPSLKWGWLGTLGLPLWGVEMSLGEGTRERVFGVGKKGVVVVESGNL